MSQRPGSAAAQRRVLAVLVLLATVMVVAATNRWAATAGEPARLVAADPPAGARLATPPAEIRLTFSGELDAGGTHVAAVKAGGAAVSAAELAVSGDAAVLPLSGLGAEQVFITYHAVFADGREVTGQQHFLIGSAAPGTPPPDPASGALDRSGAGHAHGDLGWLTAAVTLLIVAAGTGVLLVAFRRPSIAPHDRADLGEIRAFCRNLARIAPRSTRSWGRAVGRRTLCVVPEGHTIHRLAARHRQLFAGDRVAAASPQGRFADGAARLSGRVLRDTEAYGKHLLHHYDGDHTLHVHLGLYGKFADGVVPPPPVTGQLRLRLTGQRSWLDLRGPTACELLDPPEVAALRARLGADPLRDDADPDAAYRRIARSPTPIAGLLLNQSIVAGTGLIYVSEALFRARVAPTRPGRKLPPESWWQIWRDLCALMKDGMVTGRIDTVEPEHLPEAMGRPPRVDRHGGEVYVYRRAGQPCLICETEVHRSGLAGRNSYWCPTCQGS